MIPPRSTEDNHVIVIFIESPGPGVVFLRRDTAAGVNPPRGSERTERERERGGITGY